MMRAPNRPLGTTGEGDSPGLGEGDSHGLGGGDSGMGPSTSKVEPGLGVANQQQPAAAAWRSRARPEEATQRALEILVYAHVTPDTQAQTAAMWDGRYG